MKDGADKNDPRVLVRIRAGETITAANYIELLKLREQFIRTINAAASGYDAMLMPTTPDTAPTIAKASKDDETYFREFIVLIGGAATAWPLAARAQQPAMPVIGFMSSRAPEDSLNAVAAFRRGLDKGGLIEGKNVVIEFRWARGDYNRLPALAAELVSRRVALLVAVGGDPSALAAKAATSTIPIARMPDHPIIGKFGISNLSIEARLDPCRVRFFE
jgi:hypothetical protein